MPLVAVVCALLSSLVHAGAFAVVAAVQAAMASTPAPTTPPPAPVAFEAAPQDAAPLSVRWVAPHRETPLWSAPARNADHRSVLYQWVPLQVVGPAERGRTPVWDPSGRQRGWVESADIGPVDPALVGTAFLPPVGRPVAWSGPARVTMYTCVELGGCAPTASGRWPEPGMVAVDPTVIPLGSTVWIQGLGTYLAADTGSLVRGAHLDVFGLSYQDALAWGVQERAVLVYPPAP